MIAVDKLNFILKQNEKNKLSHAFLIETNNLSLCLNDIKEIIKIINYDDKNQSIDKLIDLNNLPSLVIIEPDGMNIKKNQLLDLEKKFSTKPIYSKYNNYIILNADKMNESASNAILKFLEEPENNIIGFLLVNNKENVLPTIKSRCEIVHIEYDNDQEYNIEMLKLSEEYIDKVLNTDDMLVNKELILSKYVERNQIEELFTILLNKYYKYYQESFDNVKIMRFYSKIIQNIQNVLNLIQYNVNLELILDGFVIEMRRLK